MHSRIFIYRKDNKVDKTNITTNSFDDHWFTNTIVYHG